MGKTITITCPEFKAALDEVNKYIAQQLGYTYRPKRERSPQEKGKRHFNWKHWQTELKWMNKYLDFIIEPSVSEETDVFGCKINLNLTDKATGEKTVETLNCCSAHNQMCEYQRMALKKKRA